MFRSGECAIGHDNVGSGFWFWFWFTRAISWQGSDGLGGPEHSPATANRSVAGSGTARTALWFWCWFWSWVCLHVVGWPLGGGGGHTRAPSPYDRRPSAHSVLWGSYCGESRGPCEEAM